MAPAANKPVRLPRVPVAGLAPSLERRRLQLYLTQVVADVAILLSCFAITSYLYLGRWAAPSGMLPAYILLPAYLTIALYGGTYSLTALSSWRRASLRAGMALLISAALINFTAFFAKMNEEFSRFVFSAGAITTFALMVGMRFWMVNWVRNRWGPSPINRLVIEAGGPPMTMPDSYRICAQQHGLVPSLDNPEALDRLAHYLRNMDEVIVSCPPEERARWAEVLKGSGVRGEVASDFAREIGALGIIHHDGANVSTLLVSTGPLGIRARITKRLFDLAVSIGALICLAPLFFVIAIMIKLEDGGPVFFKQRRMGRGNRFFMIYKFRSMRVEKTDADGKRSAAKDDDRITRIGRFIRKTSIDELPQIINVLRGEMSIVGPRPHALGSLAGSKLFWQVDRRYWQRHCLRPGITGLAQIRGYRGATDTEHDLQSRLRSDLEYMQGWSIWRDVRIIFSTFSVLIHDRAF